MMEIVTVSLGGLGAIARFFVNSAVHRFNGTGFPLGTIVINATGSFLVGFVMGIGSAGVLDAGAARFLTAGVLGVIRRFRPRALKRRDFSKAGSAELRSCMREEWLHCRFCALSQGSPCPVNGTDTAKPDCGLCPRCGSAEMFLFWCGDENLTL